MTAIKLCGLTSPEDIMTVNELRPEYAGFVFASWSRRYIPPDRAVELKSMLDPSVKAVGVFVDAEIGEVSELLDRGIIDMAQLHGSEDDEYIRRLSGISGKPVIKAFKIKTVDDLLPAKKSSADHILLDSGAGTGNAFDWGLLKDIQRPYFLAGGLSLMNIDEALDTLCPYAVDVSSGIETCGIKDHEKMRQFVAKVRSR